MDFADDFVVDDLLTFGYFIERGFAVNTFRFGSHARIFFPPSSLCLNYQNIIVDLTEFRMLDFFSDRQNSPFL